MNATAPERRADLGAPPTPQKTNQPIPDPPLRKESYTTWMYVGLAIIVAVLTVFGMWYAGVPRV